MFRQCQRTVGPFLHVARRLHRAPRFLGGARTGAPASVGSGPLGVRFLGGAAALANEVERTLAAGVKLDRGGSIDTKLDEELRRLREENDTIIAQVAELKKVRMDYVAQEGQMVAAMQGSGDISDSFADTLKKIEELDSQMAGLRCQQLQNSREISDLKRGKVRIEKTSEVMGLVQQANRLLSQDLEGETAALEAQVSEVLDRILDDFEGHEHIVQATKKDIESAVSRLRNLSLSLRVRRGRMDDEVFTFRGELVSSMFALQRKNAKLTRLRDMQALHGKEIADLERVLDKLKRRSRARELVAAGDSSKMKSEIKALWQDIKSTEETLHSLEQQREEFAADSQRMVDALRAPDLIGSVSAQTGELREKLIAALREEELAAARLATLRRVQAFHIKLLGDLQRVSA